MSAWHEVTCRVCGPGAHAPGCPAGDREVRVVGEHLLVDAEVQPS